MSLRPTNEMRPQLISRTFILELGADGLVLEQLHGVTFKKRAPRAIKEIKAFAHQAMVC